MKTIARVVLLALNALVSAIFVGSGTGSLNITDGDPTKNVTDVVIGLFIFVSLVILLFLGRTNIKAKKLFWYLGVGFPVVVFLWLFVG